MFRTTQDVVEMRRWAELREARPCREDGTGRLALALPGQPCGALEVGWDEFEVTFVVSHAVFVYDEAPGSRRCFVGPVDEARDFVHGVMTAEPPRAGA